MVAAYLRGFLRPNTKYGLRSMLAEDVLMEAMMSQMQVDGYTVAVISDAAVLPALTDESKDRTLRSIQAKLKRCAELRMFDVYRLNNATRHLSGKKNEISMYQLYQLASEHGILAALKEHLDTRNATK